VTNEASMGLLLPTTLRSCGRQRRSDGKDRPGRHPRPTARMSVPPVGVGMPYKLSEENKLLKCRINQYRNVQPEWQLEKHKVKNVIERNKTWRASTLVVKTL
jgi:hypothetical protein